MKTYVAKAGDVERRWVSVDASGLVLGRMAVEIARRLMGKHRPGYTPHVDTGDFVVVTNAGKVLMTGRKAEQRTIDRYTGFQSGLRQDVVADVMQHHPDRVVRLAIRRMLPKTRLGRTLLTKLKIYTDAEHPHSAQQPVDITADLAHTRRS
jgi:large subunit ribosomal protein L13